MGHNQLDCRLARVRAARGEDLPAVTAIELESFDQPYPPWYLRVLAALAGGLFLVAEEDDGVVVGYAVAVPLRGGGCHLASIAVARKCRRRGIGAALLESIIHVCEEDGRRYIVLEVEHRNYAAQRLYTVAGFIPVAVIPGYYGAGRHALKMILPLPAPRG